MSEHVDPNVDPTLSPDHPTTPERPIVAARAATLAVVATRNHRIQQLIAVLLILLVAAMSVGGYLIYKHDNDPKRILKIVDQEFANLERQLAVKGQKTTNDVCSFLQDNHLKASGKVQRDFKCPLHPHGHGSKSNPPSTSPSSTSPSQGGTTTIIHKGGNTTVVHHGGGHKSNPPHGGGGSTPPPKPSPTPTCQVVSILGKCLLP